MSLGLLDPHTLPPPIAGECYSDWTVRLSLQVSCCLVGSTLRYDVWASTTPMSAPLCYHHTSNAWQHRQTARYSTMWGTAINNWRECIAIATSQQPVWSPSLPVTPELLLITVLAGTHCPTLDQGWLYASMWVVTLADDSGCGVHILPARH